MNFSQPSWGHVKATLHQACQLVDYTPDSSTRLLHYLHIKPQISWTDQQWSSGCPHKFFKHGKGGENLLTQCMEVWLLSKLMCPSKSEHIPKIFGRNILNHHQINHFKRFCIRAGAADLFNILMRWFIFKWFGAALFCAPLTSDLSLLGKHWKLKWFAYSLLMYAFSSLYALQGYRQIIVKALWLFLLH